MLILKALFDTELQIYLINGTTTFGRKAQIVLDEKSVSREHMKIDSDKFKSVLTDLNSKHFTYINGIKTTTAVLKNKDIIRIGMSLKFEVIEIDLKISKSQVNFEPTNFISITENISDCHFLIMNQIAITLKLLLALILQKPIVKKKLFDTSFSSTDIKLNLPKNDKFSSVDLGKNITRRNLFASKTFILTNPLNESLGPAIKVAGGTVFVNNCRCVKICSCNLEKTIGFKLENDSQLFVVDKRLTSGAFKYFQISQDSIPKAILFANVNKYCVYSEGKLEPEDSNDISFKEKAAPSIVSASRSKSSRKKELKRIESTVVFQDSLNEATQDNFLTLETIPVTPKSLIKEVPNSLPPKNRLIETIPITLRESRYKENVPNSKMVNPLELIPITPEQKRALYGATKSDDYIPATPVPFQNDIIPGTSIPKRSQIDIIPEPQLKRQKFDNFDLLDDGEFEELTTPNLKSSRLNLFKCKTDSDNLFDSNTVSNKDFSHLQTQAASLKNSSSAISESGSGGANDSIKLNTQCFKNTDDKYQSDLSVFKVPVGRPKNRDAFEEIEVSGDMVSREQTSFGEFDDFLDELLDMGPAIPYTESPADSIPDSISIPQTSAEDFEKINELDIEVVEPNMHEAEKIVDVEVENLIEDPVVFKVKLESNPIGAGTEKNDQIGIENGIFNPENNIAMINIKTASLIVATSNPKTKLKFPKGIPNFKNFKSKNKIKVRMIAVGRVEHDYDSFDEEDGMDKTMKVVEEVKRDTFIDSDFELEV